MEYTILKLAKLAGVSSRTLRYYDTIGLLNPAYINASGYRVYGKEQVDTLQQILFFRELGFPLSEIKTAISAPDFNREEALLRHRKELVCRRERVSALIDTIDKTIRSGKEETEMTDQEKFESFKKNLVTENEQKYGAEIRGKYGEKTVDESNARMMNLSRQEYDEMQRLGSEILTKLEKAVRAQESPNGEVGKEIAHLHRTWLGYCWAKYSGEAHKGLGTLYVEDARFTAYYDGNVPGCAQFLHNAIEAHM